MRMKTKGTRKKGEEENIEKEKTGEKTTTISPNI